NGPDSFSYTVNDVNGASYNIANVTINVTPVNDAPVAVNDGPFTTNEDTPLNISVLANDTDAEGGIDPASIIITTGAINGTLSIAGGVVTYTPDTDYFGADSFSYTVNDVN